MITSRLLRILVVGVLAVAANPPTARSQTIAYPPVLYRLTSDSAVTFTPTNPGSEPISSPLHGACRFTRQISPLDWEMFEVSDISFQAGGMATGQLRITGQGTYRQGGRGPFVRRLQLKVSANGVPVTLDSGEVPPGDWPLLEIDAKGASPDGQGTYALHIMAVPELKRWHYRLIDGSTFLDDCAVCDRIPIYWPMRGGFDLVLIDENPLFSRYHLFNVRLQAGSPGAAQYELEGEGDYRQGGEVALMQDMLLKLRVQSVQQTRSVTFTNRSGPLRRRWPMLSAGLDETDGTEFSTHRIEVRAAPFHEIWFSTTHGLTPGTEPQPQKPLTPGDVLADTGRLVRSNSDLIRFLGLEPGTAGVGIDAFDIVPGGEVLFSVNQKVFSESLGPISAGDLLSDRGHIAEPNAALMKLFGLMPPTPDMGLDALQVKDDGEVLFSITDRGFSEWLGVSIGPGDVLSNSGQVWRSASDLLAAFHPKTDWSECGLDALFVWPNGEVWFSLENGLEDAVLGTIGDGDLISDQGYVVARNTELLGPFLPLEELANFGLDGLYVVTDLASPPLVSRLRGEPVGVGKQFFALQWDASGRVYQVERTPDLGMPFTPIAPPQVEHVFIDTAPFVPTGFYRVRQW